MLTHEASPDPKCKSNISSILTLPHPSGCLLCSNDIMIIVLLLQIIGDGKVEGSSFMLGFGGGGTGSSYHVFLFFCFVLFLCCC